jgi:ABC-type uncharacterized transport system substrate-binding protein
MRRREFCEFCLLMGASAAWTTGARAQGLAKPVIGYLSSKEEKAEAVIVAGVRKGLAAQGLTEERDFSFSFQWSAGHYERLPRLASELVKEKVDVIVASGLPAALTAKKTTSTIPIVFRLAVDPVAFDLVRSFDRPGGSITGVTMLFDPLTPKKLEILHELVANPLIGLLVNPKNPNHVSHEQHAATAVKSLGLRLTVVNAGSDGEIGSAFTTAQRAGIGSLLVGDDPLFDVQARVLVDAAARSRIPTMYYVRDFVEAGGLVSYGPSFDEMAFQVGVYLGRILRGTKPADLPVQQPTKFEFVINLKTARAIGLSIPPTMLARADEVIE